MTGNGVIDSGDRTRSNASPGGLCKDTEAIDRRLLELDIQATDVVLRELLSGQRHAVSAVRQALAELEHAVTLAHARLGKGKGRLALVGAGASGRLAVQEGAELWPTFGWPADRLLLGMAGGEAALTASVEGVEDDVEDARRRVRQSAVDAHDVVLALAASGRSPWTCAWLAEAHQCGALCLGMANNAGTPLLEIADCAIVLDTGTEVLAGSTRMAAGTAQKIALNLFSTGLMIRLNRTYGNLMVDMAASNMKLDARRVRLLQGVLPDVEEDRAREALAAADGWIKLAVLVARGQSPDAGRALLDRHAGSLRAALAELSRQ